MLTALPAFNLSNIRPTMDNTLDFTKSHNPLTPQFPSELFENIYGYSDADYVNLKNRLANTFQTPSESIVVDNASSAVIENVIVSNYETLILRENDFFVFDNIAHAYHKKIIKLARNSFLEDLEIYLQGKKDCLVLFSLVNNYEASLLSLGKIYEIAKNYPAISFVLDGAYFEYSTQTYDILYALLSLGNVSYLATFSKAYGLAGLRVGYLLSHEIKKFYPIEIKYKVSSLSCRLADYLLQDKSFLQETLRHFKSEKEKFISCGFTASDAHKVLYDNDEGLLQHLDSHGITGLYLPQENKVAFSIYSTQNNAILRTILS